MAIKTFKDYQKGAEILSRLNKYLDDLIAEKEKVTKPLNAALKAERERFKPVEVKLETAIDQVRGELGRWKMAEDARIAEEQEKISNKIAEGKISLEKGVKAMEKTEAVPEKMKTESGAISFRTDKVLKIVDEAKIPRKFLVVDEKAVKTALLAGIDVPGAVIEEVKTVINKR